MIAHSLSGEEDIKISTFKQTETPKSNLNLNVSLLNNDDWNICKMAFASPISTFKYLKDVQRKKNMEAWKRKDEERKSARMGSAGRMKQMHVVRGDVRQKKK